MKKDDVPFDKATKERFQKDQLRIESGLNHKEEYAAEVAPPVRKITYAEPYRSANVDGRDARSEAGEDQEIEELVEAVTRNKAVGYVALFVALASLFVWPVLLGVSGIILGIIAFFFGNKGLGSWSVVLGLVAVAAYFLLIPYA